ncbi:MAG TPA: hypothetical protein VIM55_19115 [Mucilaginibacter sp.]
MLEKNSLIVGILIGLIFPAVAWVVSWYLRNAIDIINRPALPYLVAIALNLIALRFLQKKELDQTGRGLMLVTFVVMILVFIFKAHIR